MKIFTAAFLVLGSSAVIAGSEMDGMTNSDYVNQWSEVAVEQMNKYKIPASITMAQAILESGSGNSMLAVKAKNHFGIKCHGWKGKKVFKDDDSKNECFRAYKSAQESFVDHSLFLTEHNRYSFLFDLDQTDYKSWAKGLKTAGYATNPKYPKLLIDLIERLDLSKLDVIITPVIYESTVVQSVPQKKSSSRSAFLKNGVKCVNVEKGDTYYSISLEFGLTLTQLYRYNDFSNEKDFLEIGDIVYLKSKKKRRLFKKEEIVVDATSTVNKLSQKYSVNAKTIRRLNDITKDDRVIAKGERITLR
ncbi:MAG: glucosaminidase domain-containing protein [Flavobacteriales bacterium]|nr:glucosaminidase domain-containing protein [Flavobacteriales bacterium]